MTGRLAPRAALLLVLYTLARLPAADLFKDLGEKTLEGTLSAAMDEPVDALLVLLGVGTGLIGTPMTAGAGIVLAHLVAKYAKHLRRRKLPVQFYGEFRRDFYAFMDQMREELGPELYEQLATLAELEEDSE